MSIIIVGGGMAGATLALAISHFTAGRLPVHLIEATLPDTISHPGFDARAIALAQETCQQLARIGVWSLVKPYATAIKSVHVSDRGHAGFVTIDAQDYQLAALGQVVELHEMGQQLFTLLHKAPGVTLHCPQRLKNVVRKQDGVQVTLDSQQTIQGQLLVAADGSRSTVAAQCGIGWKQRDYEQIAVITNVTTSNPHKGQAWERFTGHGPLAMLPMSNGRCSLVWCHPKSMQTEIAAWSDEQFTHTLQTCFGWRLGRITQVGARNIYPLALRQAERLISHRVVLVGNAAQTLHPVAGQGFNLGLRDVIVLAQMLAIAHQQQRDPGSYNVLAEYQAQRKEDKCLTTAMTDGLISLFANRWAPLVAGRNLGLIALDNCSPVRDILVRRALGWIPH